MKPDEVDDGHAPREDDMAGDDGILPGGESFEDEPERPPGPLSRFPSSRHALPAILIFIVCCAFTLLYAASPVRDYLWLSGETLFEDGEWWRSVTAIVTHADIPHLLANSLILVVFGWMLHAYFGMGIFPLAALGVGILANIATISLYEPGVRLLGASGMTYGMVALWLVFYLRHDTDRGFPSRIFRAIGFSFIMLVPVTLDPRVSHLSHGIGFLIGLLCGLPLSRMFHPRMADDPPPVESAEKSS